MHLLANVQHLRAHSRSLASRRANRFAYYWATRLKLLRWRCRRRLFDQVEEILHSPTAHLVMWELDGSERRPKVGGNDLLVIKPDDRHIVRHAEPEVPQAVVGAHRSAIGAAEHRRGRCIQAHELLDMVIAAVRLCVA